MAEAQARKEAPQQREEKSAAATSTKRPDWIGAVLLALVGLNVLALVGMGYFMQKLYTRFHELQQSTKRPVPTATEEADGVGKELQPQNLGALFPMEGFLVNIASEQGAKFLQVQMELELSEPALEDEVSRKKAAIRDAIIVLLSSRSYRQLKEANGIKLLRQDILQAINHLLSSGKIKDIYFTQFHFN